MKRRTILYWTSTGLVCAVMLWSAYKFSLDPAMNISEENDAQYVARLEASPAMKAAIESAGMSVRDYAYTSQSLVATSR